MAYYSCENCKHYSWNYNRHYCTDGKKYGSTEIDSVDEANSCRYYEESESSSSSSGSVCFITTVICDVLGYADDCEIMETLRNFRETYLRPRVEHTGILEEYGIIGPKISTKIAADPDRCPLAADLEGRYLRPVFDLIQQGRNEEAIQLYKGMVQELMQRYQLD